MLRRRFSFSPLKKSALISSIPMETNLTDALEGDSKFLPDLFERRALFAPLINCVIALAFFVPWVVPPSLIAKSESRKHIVALRSRL